MPDLAALAALGHALGGFQAVEVVAVDAAVADTDALGERPPYGMSIAGNRR